MTPELDQVLAEHLAAAARAAGVEDLVRELLGGGMLPGADPRPGERRDNTWRGSEEDGESSGHTVIEDDGECVSCDRTADEALDALRRAPALSASPRDGDDRSQGS